MDEAAAGEEEARRTDDLRPCGNCPGTEEPLPRRRFIDWVLGTSVGALLASILYPVLRFVVPPERAEAAATSTTLKPADIEPNSGRIFNFGGKPAIILRTPGGELRAFSAICTHLACTVQYREDLAHIWCACHNGHYDLHGVNIAGPPPRPLEEYAVKVRGETLVVAREA